MSYLAIQSSREERAPLWNPRGVPPPTPDVIFIKYVAERILPYLSLPERSGFMLINKISWALCSTSFPKVNSLTSSAFYRMQLLPKQSWLTIRDSIIALVKNKLSKSGQKKHSINTFRDYFGYPISLAVLESNILSIKFGNPHEIRIASGEIEYCHNYGGIMLCQTETTNQVKTEGEGVNFVISPQLPNIDEAPHQIKTSYNKDTQLNMYELEKEFTRYSIEEDGSQLERRKYKRYDKPSGEGVEISKEEYEPNKHLKGYSYTYLGPLSTPNYEKEFLHFLDCFIYNFYFVKEELSEGSTLTNKLVKNLIRWTSSIPTDVSELIKNLTTDTQVVESTTCERELISTTFSIRVWNKHHGRDCIYTITWEQTKEGISLKSEKTFQSRSLGGKGEKTWVLENSKGVLRLKIKKYEADRMTGAQRRESFYTITNVNGNWRFNAEGYTSELLMKETIIPDHTDSTSLGPYVVKEPKQKWVSFGTPSSFSEEIQTQEELLTDMCYSLSSLYTLFKLLSDRDTIIIEDSPNTTNYSSIQCFKECQPSFTKDSPKTISKPIRTIQGQVVSNLKEFEEYVYDSYGAGPVHRSIIQIIEGQKA